MKRLIATVCMLGLFFLMCFGAGADVIDLPETKNSFALDYNNYEDCIWEMREYRVVNPAGAKSYYMPGVEDKVVMKLKEGDVVLVSYTYLIGDAVYGLVNYGSWKEDSWFSLADFELVYDYISFAEEHGDEFYPWGQELDDVFDIAIRLYAYPGSDVIEIATENYSTPTIVHAYRDENDVEWGFVSNDFGYFGVWLCLDNLEMGELPPQPEKGLDPIWLVAGGVAVFVLLMAVLIVVLGRRRKKQQ